MKRLCLFLFTIVLLNCAFSLSVYESEIERGTIKLSHAGEITFSGRTYMDAEKFHFSGEIRLTLDNTIPVFLHELISELLKNEPPASVGDILLRATCKKPIALIISDVKIEPMIDGDFFLYRISPDIWFNHEILFGFPEGKKCGFTIHEISFPIQRRKEHLEQGDLMAKLSPMDLKNDIKLKIKVKIGKDLKVKRVHIKGKLDRKIKKQLIRDLKEAKILNGAIAGKKITVILSLKSGKYGPSIYMFKTVKR
ncbi:hypothetical protein KAU32_07240 [bacterium]|nr:hypothetical protein [bacterium]